ncbi:hypothetical protein [Pseudoalteromonas umbrosa]|uniref:hypothetical protein n=1 Tax=Pseudoalteromonas umbrosa TaxID=3048489 RepID=UPI0024C33BC2|nr:hypothetical protein [Pseudoalteromonas sp. B95]MDK1286640.1 hypothetical protein [Pseudoalteromonas sp. B95]
MLSAIQKIDSHQIAEDLKEIEAVYTSRTFLSGLFLGSNLPKNIEGIRVYNNVKEVDMRIVTSDEYYNKPNSHPFKHFPHLLEEESGRYLYKAISPDKRKELRTQYKALTTKFANEFGYYVDEVIARHTNSETYIKTSVHADMPIRHVQWLFERCVPNVIYANFIMIVEATIFVGLENSPISQRMLDCYRLGGMPGGWVGPLPKDGGLAKDCMELYHLGS